MILTKQEEKYFMENLEHHQDWALDWIQRADADEIVDKVILVAQFLSVATANKFYKLWDKRAKADPGSKIDIANILFCRNDTICPEAAACIKFNIKVQDEWTQDIGQRAFKEAYRKGG